ncbi:uncharacterized protein PF3D7_1120000-like [Ruditapes philippinarum]|uniref:uncharacterized protein PF3D7_1120000-like n=1 Tax=Ruditapes philippinarum TaxID=129788 RepID=UPI00295B59B8|nr:uncharacterized protein PF3D7_1120000-like [Ruditapes philippinarum]
MWKYGYSRDDQASSSVAFQKKYDLDVDDIRIRAKLIYEASKNLSKEQKNIHRKRNKSKGSKQLQKCMGNYDEGLREIREELGEISYIVNEDNDDKGFNSRNEYERSASLNAPKKKNRKDLSDTFTSGAATECFRCLSKETKIQDLELKLKRTERSSQQNIMQLTETLDDLQRRHDKLEQRFREEVRLKDDALQRLSKAASSKLRDNNPNITDLSDQNRPTKVAEKLSELYDNQWTDAFDILEHQMEEKQVIQTLLKILMTAYTTCQDLSSRHFFERVQKAIELPTEVAEISNYQVVLSDQFKQEIKEFRKNRAPFVIRDVEKAVRPRLPLAKHQSKDVQDYVTACVEIAWLCAVQDPPLKLDAQFTDKFETNVLKDYTKRGEFVDFVVWPAMFLHKGGPLLSKGVAQGRCGNQPREVPDRPISVDTRKDGYNTQTGTNTHRHFSNQQTEQYHYRDHQSHQRPDNRNQHNYNKSKTMYAPRTNAPNDYGHRQRYPTHSTEI